MLAHIGTGTPSRITSDCMIKRSNCISASSANTTTDRYATGLMLDFLKLSIGGKLNDQRKISHVGRALRNVVTPASVTFVP
jgi:hypothetical protein